MTPAQLWVLWAGLATAGVALIVLAIGLRGDPARGRRRCPRCWYDLAGLSGGGPVVCPECGHQPRRERSVFRRRRYRRTIVIGVIVLGSAAAMIGWPLGSSGEWVAYTPTPVLRGVVALASPGRSAGPVRAGGISTRWTRAVAAWSAAESMAENPYLSWWTMGAYGEESRVAEARIAQLLRSESAVARERAAHALGSMPRFGDRHADRIGRMLATDPSADVRFACFEALRGACRPGDGSVFASLAAALREPDRDLRSYYALRLAMLSGAEGHADVLLAPMRAARDGPGVWESAEKAIADYELRVVASTPPAR